MQEPSQELHIRQIELALQHTPLPERLGNFERTVGPAQAREVDGQLLIVEYRHLLEDVLFQVLAQDDTATFLAVVAGEVRPLGSATVEEAGHLLRRDLLMTLEDLEDDL